MTGIGLGPSSGSSTMALRQALSALSILRGGLYLAIGLAVLPYGAVLDHHFFAASFVTGLVLLGATLVPLREQTRTIVRAAMYPLALAIAFILAQSLLLPGHPFAHPIWSSASLIGIEGGAVSVDPAGTRRALLSFILPFAIFLAAIALHDSDEGALRLWRRLAFLGAAIALFGLTQYLVTPDRLLFWERLPAMRGVTGVFANANTAATFFGLALLLLIGVGVDAFRGISPRGLREWLLKPVVAASNPYLRFYLILASILVTSLALVLTLSRGGVTASFAALAPVLVWAGLRYGMREAPRWKRVLFSIGFAGLILLAILQMATRTAVRIETGGLEDGRWCIVEGTMRAISDSPLWGTGFGTFERVFPIYRDPGCLFHGTIDTAHNVYLEAYLGMGVMAPVLAAIFLWILFSALRQGGRRHRYRFAGVIGAAIVFLILLHGLVDFSLQVPGVAVYLAAALAAAVSLSLGRSQPLRQPGHIQTRPFR
jgi:O-antigen ligase